MTAITHDPEVRGGVPWPKDVTTWQVNRTGYMSIPFTWLLPNTRARLLQADLFVDQWIVGGPAVKLMPEYLEGLPGVMVGRNGSHVADMPGVLQRVNPLATRTTVGCIRQCSFCGVRRIEGGFRELDDWPDLPILCDNNLLAASYRHFDRVIDRLIVHGWCDFNQGLDARILSRYHALRIAKIKKPIVRLALDHENDREPWESAVKLLLDAGIAKSRIRSYVLCGYDTGPDAARARCEYVENTFKSLKALPMWFHELDSLEFNSVTERQKELGWTNRKRRELFCWYYQHRTLEVRG